MATFLTAPGQTYVVTTGGSSETITDVASGKTLTTVDAGAQGSFTAIGKEVNYTSEDTNITQLFKSGSSVRGGGGTGGGLSLKIFDASVNRPAILVNGGVYDYGNLTAPVSVADVEEKDGALTYSEVIFHIQEGGEIVWPDTVVDATTIATTYEPLPAGTYCFALRHQPGARTTRMMLYAIPLSPGA